MSRVVTVFLWLFSFGLIFPMEAAARVQWASRLIKYSSQFGPKSFSAAQVLGKPNAFPSYGMSLVAWRPAEGKRNMEYVQVAFEEPVSGVQQIAIVETYNVGSVSKVILIDVNGQEYIVFQNNVPKGDRVPEAYINRIFIPPSGFRVAQLRLELNTSIFPDNPLIDAIGISTSRDPISAGVNLASISTPLSMPQNLGSGINSEYDDMLPIISPDGNTLYFARKKAPENIGTLKADDIYRSVKDVAGRWGPAEHLGPPLNDDNHNFVCTVSPDGNTLVLANRYSNGRGDGVSVSTKKGQNWTKPQPLPVANMYNISDFACYHMGVDGKTIVMAIERNDTYGDMDLYVSFMYADGQWTEPKSLGPVVNTAAAEASVFLAADGKTIYFSSQGHPGFGEFDMYMSKRLDNSWNNWSEPINLGEPFNSPLSDYYYTIPASGDYAYFSSNDNSYGRSDLFRIPLPPELRPEPVTMLKATVQTVNTQKPYPQGASSSNSKQKPAEQLPPVTLIMPANDQELLYKNFKGYYPVEKNGTMPVPGLAEEDNARNSQTIPQSREQQQLNDLQLRLQQLKNEQASLQYAIAQKPNAVPVNTAQPPASGMVPPLQQPYVQQVPSAPVNYPPAVNSYPSQATKQYGQNYYGSSGNDLASLDAKLAELRSKKDNLANNIPATGAYPTAVQPNNQAVQPAAVYAPPVSSYPYQSQEYQAYPPANSYPPQNYNPYTQGAPSQQQPYPSKQPPAYVNTGPTVTDKMNDYSQKINELREQQNNPKPVPAPVTVPAVAAQLPVTTPQPDKVSQDQLRAYEEKLQKLREQMNPIETAQSQPPVTTSAETKAVQPQELQPEKPQANAPTTLPESIQPSQEIEKENINPLLQSSNELAEGNNELARNNQELTTQNVQLSAQRLQLDSLIKVMESERESIAQEKKKLEEDKMKLEQQKELQIKEIAQLERQIDQLSQSKFKTQAALQQAKLELNEPEVQYAEKESDIILMPLEKGSVLQVDNIFFNANATFLKSESYSQLNKIVAFLRSNPNIKVEIGGHTNGLCDDDFCLYLSDGRAKAVKEYIISQGIPANRVTHMGYGRISPIADNNTTEGRLRNQRVEMKIVEIN